MKCIFRTDGSLEMGSGHLVRCCNLAKALEEANYEILFLTQNLSGNLEDVVKSHGFPFEIINKNLDGSNVPLSWEQDALNSLLHISANDLIIVDNYNLDYRWETQVKLKSKCLIVIDDLANRKHNCHALIDSNFYKKSNRYENLINADAIQLLGPNYCILNKSFLPYLRSSESLNQSVESILLFFGGNDFFNLNEKCVEFIEEKWPEQFKFVSVVGKNSSFNQNLFQLKEQLGERYTIHVQTQNMANLMQTSDLFIGSGGTVTWERSVKSLPSIVIAVAENQVQASTDLDAANAISYVGNYSQLQEQIWPRLEQKLQELLENPRKRIELACNSFKLVDGQGVQRILKTITDVLQN